MDLAIQAFFATFFTTIGGLVVWFFQSRAEKSDEVVQAHNALWTHIYESEVKGQDPRELMRLWASLLLAVRRSVGNADTKLDEWDMLAAQIKDIETLRNPAKSATGASRDSQ